VNRGDVPGSRIGKQERNAVCHPHPDGDAAARWRRGIGRPARPGGTRDNGVGLAPGGFGRLDGPATVHLLHLNDGGGGKVSL